MEQKSMEVFLKEFIDERLISLKGTINSQMDYRFVSCDASVPSLTLAFPIMKWQLNPMNQMHGGMICTALDVAMGCMAYTGSEGKRTPTIDMSVSFVRGATLHDTLLVEAKLTMCGRRIAKVSCVATSQNTGKIIATAMGSYIVNEQVNLSS